MSIPRPILGEVLGEVREVSLAGLVILFWAYWVVLSVVVLLRSPRLGSARS